MIIQDGVYSGRIFVSNVRSGTVTRLDLDVDLGGVFVKQATQIASGYTSQSDPAALIVGPTGLAYDANADVLYVVSTAVMRFSQSRTPAQQITQMGPGTVIYNDPAHLRGPLGLAFAPNGRLLTSNDDAPSVTSTTPPLYGAHGQAAHGRHSDVVFLAHRKRSGGNEPRPGSQDREIFTDRRQNAGICRR